MTFQQFIYVVKIAEMGSFSAASKELYVTQPSLSKAIMELEEELNTTLFIREQKGVRLTESGSKFLVYAHQAIQQLELIRNEFNNESKDVSRFSVGSQHYNFVTEAFSNLIEEHRDDKYDFAIKEIPTSQIIDEVKNGQLELGVIYMSKFNENIIRKVLKDSGIEFEFVFREKPSVCVNTKNELSKKSRVAFSDLEGMPRIRYDQGMEGSFFFFEELYSNRSTSRNITVTDRGTMAMLLDKLGAYTISTGLLSSHLRKLGTVAVPLASDDYIDIGIIYIKDKALSPLASRFVELMKTSICNEKNVGL